MKRSTFSFPRLISETLVQKRTRITQRTAATIILRKMPANTHVALFMYSLISAPQWDTIFDSHLHMTKLRQNELK